MKKQITTSTNGKVILRVVAVICIITGVTLLVKSFADSMYLEPTQAALDTASVAKLWGFIGGLLVVLAVVLLFLASRLGTKHKS